MLLGLQNFRRSLHIVCVRIGFALKHTQTQNAWQRISFYFDHHPVLITSTCMRAFEQTKKNNSFFALPLCKCGKLTWLEKFICDFLRISFLWILLTPFLRPTISHSICNLHNFRVPFYHFLNRKDQIKTIVYFHSCFLLLLLLSSSSSFLFISLLPAFTFLLGTPKSKWS